MFGQVRDILTRVGVCAGGKKDDEPRGKDRRPCLKKLLHSDFIKTYESRNF